MRRARTAVLSLPFLVAACGDREPAHVPEPAPAADKQAEQPEQPEKETPDAPPAEEPAAEAVPRHIVYDQILIAFKGSYRVKNPRTQREEILSDTDRPEEAAKELAAKVFDLARSGGDFAALKDAYTDARGKEGEPSGLIHAALDGVRKDTREIYRSTLYPGPAAVVFKLRKDEVGIIEHDPKSCPDGWLIVKRVQ